MNNPDLPVRADRVVDTETLTDWIIAQIRRNLPTVDPRLALTTVAAVAPSSRGLAIIFRHLREHPHALTSGQPEIPPVMSKLIRALANADTGAVLPRCSRCDRPARHLPMPVDGGRLCPRCIAEDSQELCRGCGRLRPVNVRDENGPRCQTCRTKEPARHRQCDGCGQVRLLSRRRLPGQPALCSSCYRGPILPCTGCGQLRPTRRCTARGGDPTCSACWPRTQRRCDRCGRTRRILTRWPLGEVCGTCYAYVRHHPAPCADCGASRPLIGLDPAGHRLCGPCAGQPQRDYTCPRCGQAGFANWADRCVHCEAADRVHELLLAATINPDPAAAQFAALATALIDADAPRATLAWLAPGGAAADLLARLRSANQPISHALLDELPPGLALHRLRQTLVHAGLLPERDDYLERLVPWLDHLLADCPAEHAQLLRAYTHWTLLRRARRRSTERQRPATSGSGHYLRAQVRAALNLLTSLTDQDTPLAELTQLQLDRWLVARPTDATYNARQFVSWLRRHGLVGDLEIPKKPQRDVLVPITEDERWAHLRRCLHDDTLTPAVRAAGALVLLYGLPVSRISSLRRTDVHTDGTGATVLELGGRPLRLPPAVAALLIRQRDHGASPAAFHRDTDLENGWLFPGGLPGKPASHSLHRALRTYLTVHLRRARSAALASLAADLPPPVLAGLLDIALSTAIGWSHYAQHDWSAYLAARTDSSPTYMTGNG